MFDTTKMMRSLSNLPFEELVALSVSEGAQSCAKPSKVELITAIIAHRAYMTDRFVPTKNERKKYQLRTEDDNYYLRLTDEQATMLEWCSDREISFYNSEINEINDVEWETP